MKRSHASKNREQLQHDWSSILLLYDTFYTNGLPDLSKEKEILGGGNLTDAAASHLSNAIDLMTADYDSKAFQLVIPVLQQAFIVAEEALRTNNYGINNMFGANSIISEKLFYSHLLLANNISANYLSNAIKCSNTFFSLSPDDEIKITKLIPLYYYDKDFKEIIRLFCEVFKYSINSNIPLNTFKQNRWHVVYLASKYELGESNIYNIVQQGITLWYDRGKNWTVFPKYKMYNIERIFWSYLYGKYMVREMNLINIIHDMRGF